MRTLTVSFNQKSGDGTAGKAGGSVMSSRTQAPPNFLLSHSRVSTLILMAAVAPNTEWSNTAGKGEVKTTGLSLVPLEKLSREIPP